MARSQLTRRQTAQRLNTVIDQALLRPSADHQLKLIQIIADNNVRQLAERIRRRATLLGKPRRGDRARLLRVRDELILAVYASAVPSGWSCAWVDGSSITIGSHRQAGIGGLLMDTHGTVIEQISRPIGEQGAFEAEVAALAAILQSAIDQQQFKLWVYCDNQGLVQFWHEQRDDRRLDAIRALVEHLEKFALRGIPRQHNHSTHVLARQAARG